MELRQKSFEDRQSVNEQRIAETRVDVAEIKKDFELHMTEHKLISDRINVNTRQLAEIRDTIEPISEGIHAIRESVKVLGWLGKAIKWIGTTTAGVIALVYGWVEYFSHLGKH